MAMDGSGNCDQGSGLAARTAIGGVAYGFAITAEMSFGEIDEGGLTHVSSIRAETS
jgi:hypothetical protein